MTRSKSPFDQPPAWRDPQDQAGGAAGNDPYLNWPQQPHQHPAHDPNAPAGHHGAAPPQAGYDPHAAPHYARPAAHYGDPAGGQQPYAPQHDPYANHDGTAGHQAPGYGYGDYNVPPTQPPGHQQQPYGDNGATGAPHLRTRLRELDAENGGWQQLDMGTGQAPPYHHQPVQTHDPQGYDLGNYMHVGAGNSERPGFGEPGYQPPHEWAEGGHGYQDPRFAPGQQRFDQAGVPVQGFAHPESGAVTQHGDVYDDGDDYDYDYEDEEGTGGTRKLVIAAALVSTIVVGGGFAYGYNLLFSEPSKKSGTPIVSAEKSPSKVQPSDPGGRKFEHTDSRLMNKIGNNAGSDSAVAGRTEGTNGRPKVSTLVVGRDGRLIVPDASKSGGASPVTRSSSSQSTASVSASPVPGMMIVGTQPPSDPPQTPNASTSATPGTSAATQVPAATSNQQQAKAVQSQPPVTTRRRSNLPPLPVRSGIAKPGVTLAPPARTPGVTQANVRQVVPRTTRQAQPPATRTSAAPATSAANGYVAVLSTKRSRIDALTSFADLQQRYGSILSSKVPDVRRADLSSRGLGVMYRAVVGPPASRQVATQLCNRLKTAGYNGCWVAPY